MTFTRGDRVRPKGDLYYKGKLWAGAEEELEVDPKGSYTVDVRRGDGSELFCLPGSLEKVTEKLGFPFKVGDVVEFNHDLWSYKQGNRAVIYGFKWRGASVYPTWVVWLTHAEYTYDQGKVMLCKPEVAAGSLRRVTMFRAGDHTNHGRVEGVQGSKVRLVDGTQYNADDLRLERSVHLIAVDGREREIAAELDKVRSERDEARGHLEILRLDLDKKVSELELAQRELEKVNKELAEAREALERVPETPSDDLEAFKPGTLVWDKLTHEGPYVWLGKRWDKDSRHLCRAYSGEQRTDAAFSVFACAMTDEDPRPVARERQLQEELAERERQHEKAYWRSRVRAHVFAVCLPIIAACLSISALFVASYLLKI